MGDDFEAWMTQTFVLWDPTIDRSPKLVVGKVAHPVVLSARQTARLICYLTTWLGDLPLKELFPEDQTDGNV